jgi:CBS domain-containing protein
MAAASNNSGSSSSPNGSGKSSRSLGRSLRADSISSLPLRPACMVAVGDSIETVVKEMGRQGVGYALVMDGPAPTLNADVAPPKLVGIFTERDFVGRVVAPRLDVALPVERVMTRSPRVARVKSSVMDAIALMEQTGLRHLPVIDDTGRPTGVVSVKQIVHYLVQFFPGKVYNLPPTPDVAQPAREGA